MAAGPAPGSGDPRLRAVALTGDELEAPERVPEERRRSEAAFEQARSRLADRLLDDVWHEAAALDVGVWGPSVSEAEAERALREAIDRGAAYLDPAAPPARTSLIRRLTSFFVRRSR